MLDKNQTIISRPSNGHHHGSDAAVAELQHPQHRDAPPRHGGGPDDRPLRPGGPADRQEPAELQPLQLRRLHPTGGQSDSQRAPEPGRPDSTQSVRQRYSQALLSLVESFRVMKYFHSDASPALL